MTDKIKYKIVHSTAGDEELLIPTAEEVSVLIRRDQQQNPPKCMGCCNTKCGSYFISGLQMANGILHLTACLAYANSANDQDGQITLYIGMFMSFLSLFAGYSAFVGLSNSKHEMLSPAIILTACVTFVCSYEFFYMASNWDDIADRVRVTLKDYFHSKDIYNDEIRIDEIADVSQETATGIEATLSEDDQWEMFQLTLKMFMYVAMTIYISINTLFLKTMITHKQWMKSKM